MPIVINHDKQKGNLEQLMYSIRTQLVLVGPTIKVDNTDMHYQRFG